MPKRLRQLKGHRHISALTAYDMPMAHVVAEGGVDVILVGDSLGMVVLGYDNTHFVTMEDMIRHTQAVMRGVARHEAAGGVPPLVVADMPVSTCDTPESALKNCRRMVKETGVRAVKIEGLPNVCQAVVDDGIEVMGHTGLKPQTSESMKVKGRDEVAAQAILEEALALETAGCFAVVLECVPSKLGARITEAISIPTIGIGAGAECDGQILVLHDILGLFPDFRPKFAKRYVDARSVILKGVQGFVNEVDRGLFPSPDHQF